MLLQYTAPNGEFSIPAIGSTRRTKGLSHVVPKHYRELVKPDAERWFNVRLERPTNVTPVAATA